MEKDEVLRAIEEAARRKQIELDLSENGLTSLPAEIKELKDLTTLVLSNNQLKTLPKEIAELKNLTKLDLSDNELETLPAEIMELKDLTVLGLSDNELETLPAEIRQLKNLTTLVLSNIRLRTLPEEIKELENLTTLVLSNNQLKTLPREIEELKNLTTLVLSNNRLIRLPREIVELKNLTWLDLSRNRLKTLSAGIMELKDLTTLVLSNNQLKTLPKEIAELKNLTKLYLSGNPLVSPPPEIVAQGFESIFEYLQQLPEEAIEHNEAKMILVGQGDVGKTCLAKRLIYDVFVADKSTEGIDIFEWEITAPTTAQEKIKLNVWDFGGQEIYHATHQFFLTKRSIYLLVWNARRALDFEQIYYWLHTIEAFGEDSPIILVMSKLNERSDDLNMKELREKFPQIIELYKVDSEDRTGISALKDIIRETAWHLPHMRTPWIESWFMVRERLEHDRRNWIEYEEFKQICESEGLDNKQTDILDEYLHDLGVIIHFRDRLELRNMVILKPEWATKAFYKILGTQSVLDSGGILLHSELDQIWDPTIYPPDIFPKLLELMNKFELVYELPDKKSHLVAELLPKTEPEFEWDDEKNLCFYYHYDFLPAGVITRFIVRVHYDLEKKSDGTHLCWREGAILVSKDARALVKVKPLEKRIEIKSYGPRKGELLASIRSQFDHINRSTKKVDITKEIPCNCSTGCNKVWNYNNLLNLRSKKIDAITCDENCTVTKVSSMLDGYEIKEEYPTDERLLIYNQNIIDFKPKIGAVANINLDIKIDLPTIQSDFEELKDLMVESDPDPNLERKLKEIGDSLDEVNAETEKEKLNKPLNKLGRFLQKSEDKDSKYHKIVSGTKKGIELAQQLAVRYNKFARELGLSEVKDLFLGL